MANKQFNVRQTQKHDTEANWNLTDGFIPFDGELIVYDKDDTHDKPRIKFGDGTTDVKDLPFSGEDVSSVNGKKGAVVLNANDVGADPAGSSGTVASTLAKHVGDTKMHTTTAEKARWNAKYNKPADGIPDTDLNAKVTERLLPTKTSSDAGKVPVATKNGVSWQNLPDNELFIITVERDHNNRTDVSYTDARAAYNAGKTLLLKLTGYGYTDLATLCKVQNDSLWFSGSVYAYHMVTLQFTSSGISETFSNAVRSINGKTDDDVSLPLQVGNGYLWIYGDTNKILSGMALVVIKYNDGGAMFAKLLNTVLQALASANNCHLRIANPATHVVPWSYAIQYRLTGQTYGLAICLDEDDAPIIFGIPCGGVLYHSSESDAIAIQFRIPVSLSGTDVIVSAVITITTDGVIYIDAEKISGYTDLGGKTLSELTAELKTAFEALPYSDYAAMETGQSYTVGGYSWSCNSADSPDYRTFSGNPENVSCEVHVNLDSGNETVTGVDVLVI